MPGQITFLQPYFLLLLLGIPALLYFWLKGEKNNNAVFKVPSAAAFSKAPDTFRTKLLKWLPYFRALALGFIIIALARPQTPSGVEITNKKSIDIVLATDVSRSMLAKDFSPNRLEAAKNVAADFINHRPQDRIGLVIFSGESFTLCPITTDHNVLKQMLENASNGMLQDGTAIGMGLATATDRLRQSKTKSKVIILLTDGVNNAGIIDPATAAEIAKSFNIKVYTIGMVSEIMQRQAEMMRQNQMEAVDEKLMQQIAKVTGGKYFRATDDAKLRDIYAEIDRLEKTKVESQRYLPKTEAFYPWLWLAFFVLGTEFILRFFYLKTLT